MSIESASALALSTQERIIANLQIEQQDCHLLRNRTQGIAEIKHSSVMNAIVIPINEAFAAVVTNARAEAIAQNLDAAATEDYINADRSRLNRNLSLLFHPDRLNGEQPNALRQPIMHLVNSCEEGSSFRNDILNCGSQTINGIMARPPNFADFANNPQAAAQNFNSFNNSNFIRIFYEYQRYIKLLATMIYVTQAALNLILFSAAASLFIMHLIYALAQLIILAVENILIGFVLGNAFNDLYEAELTDAKIISHFRRTNPEIYSGLSDEEVMHTAGDQIRLERAELSSPPLTDQEVHTQLKKRVEDHNLNHFSRLSLIIQATKNEIVTTRPGEFYFYIPRRLLVLAIMSPLIVFDAFRSLVDVVTKILIQLIFVFLCAIKIAATLLINAPLYIYDALFGNEARAPFQPEAPAGQAPAPAPAPATDGYTI